MKVADHVWYVTGGASGLGEATVRTLHGLGGYVSIWDINDEKSEALVQDLNKSGSKRATSAHVDVVDEDDVKAAIESSDKAFPSVPVGGCVNCGGVAMVGKVSASADTLHTKLTPLGKIINADGEPFVRTLRVALHEIDNFIGH